MDLSEEKGGGYVVRVDLPGVSKEDLDISVDDAGVLSVSGTRERNLQSDGETFFRQERSFGRFQRRVKLPADANADQAEAKFADGVLSLTIPKRPEEQQRKKIRIE